jgi:hypothetical protein
MGNPVGSEPWHEEVSWCRNCGGVKCTSCVVRELHDACVDDCPECCNLPLWDDGEPREENAASLY